MLFKHEFMMHSDDDDDDEEDAWIHDIPLLY